MMRRTLLLCLALGLGLTASGGQAQVLPVSRVTSSLNQMGKALAGQPVRLQLLIAHDGAGKTVIGGLRNNGGLRDNTVPCPDVKVHDKAGGPPLVEQNVIADCDTGKNVAFTSGQRRLYTVTLPMKLTPGEYTVVLTLRSQPPITAQAKLQVGPGPFVTELVLPNGAKAGQPLDLRVAYRNVWRSAVSQDLRLCGRGMLIRDDQGTTVYDNKTEGMACITNLVPTTVPAGAVHLEPWGPLPSLKAGQYTAILWGGLWGEALLRFEVKP